MYKNVDNWSKYVLCRSGTEANQHMGRSKAKHRFREIKTEIRDTPITSKIKNVKTSPVNEAPQHQSATEGGGIAAGILKVNI